LYSQEIYFPDNAGERSILGDEDNSEGENSPDGGMSKKKLIFFLKQVKFSIEC